MARISKNNAAFEAVGGIRDLHRAVQGPYDNLICKHCTYILLIARPDAPEDAFIMYPCPTINILDGDFNES